MLRTEFTSLRNIIASPGLSDMPFFACCLVRHKLMMSFTAAINATSQSWLSVDLSLPPSGTRLLRCDPFRKDVGMIFMLAGFIVVGLD